MSLPKVDHTTASRYLPSTGDQIFKTNENAVNLIFQAIDEDIEQNQPHDQPLRHSTDMSKDHIHLFMVA